MDSVALVVLGGLGGLVTYATFFSPVRDEKGELGMPDPYSENGYTNRKRPYGEAKYLDASLDDDFNMIVAVEMSSGPNGTPRVIVEGRGGARYVLPTVPSRLPNVVRSRSA
jgi:hypothetical protein